MKTPKFLQTSGSPTRTRKRVPISDIRRRTSDNRQRTSDVTNRTSDIRYRTLDIRHQTSDIGHRTSVRCPISDVQSPKSAVWCLMSDQWTLDIWNPYSSNFFFEKKSSVFWHVTLSGLILVQGFFWVSFGLLWVFIFPLLIVIPVS